MNQVEVLPTPIKSKADKKDYRLIKLPNGVKALLIRKVSESSAESDRDNLAAANVTIKIGSFDNPPKALGLAHFLEHMVHMGTVKYPEESTYNDFLSANGGKRNAVTSSEYTGYYFSVSEKAFPEALDRLEQLIEAPLLLKGSMQREREAVDSEYEMKKTHDAVRVESILKSLVSDSHPARLFDFGNIKTLKDDISDDDLHAEMLKLHAKYAGNKIVVAVQSKKTLDELQALVVQSFSSIKSGSESEVDKEPQTVDGIFKPEFYDKMFFVKPKSGKKAMMMSFVVPSIQRHYKCSPVDYLAYVFKNEGEGGLATYLKDKHLVTEVGIFMQENAFICNSKFALVRVVCDLTGKGTENIGEVLDAIYSYLLMIKQAPIEEHRRLFNEQVEKTKIDFDFAEESSPMDNVTKYTGNMLIYDDIDAVRGSSIYQAFDENIVVDIIERLNQRKFNLIFISDKHLKYDKKEKYFGTEYSEVDFPTEYQRLWDERKAKPEFFLEKPNPFKTTHFEIFKVPDESQVFPMKIHDSPKIQAWHKLDKKYNMPHVHFDIQFISPVIKESIRNYLGIKLYSKCLAFHLKKKLSQASTAGYGVQIDDNRNGLILKFQGFNDKIALLIDIVTKFLPKCMDDTDDNLFKTVREDLKETFSEKLLTYYGLNGDHFAKVLLEQHFTKLELYHEIDNVSLADVKDLATKLFQKLKIEALVQGNMTKSQALEVLAMIDTNMNFEPLEDDIELKQRCYQLPFASTVIRMKSLAPNNDNSFIKDYYQIGADTNRARNLARLVESILNPKAYDYLRTKMQLGYGVSCQVEEKGGLVGITVLVLSQESKNSYRKVSELLETFMNDIAKKTFAELTDEEFMTFKEARIKRLLAEDLDLNTEVAKNWNEIRTHDYMFDRFGLCAEDTRSITKSDLQDFFESFTQPENMRKFGVHVIGNLPDSDQSSVNETTRELNLELITEKLNEEENVITNIDDFRRKLYLHPVVREVVPKKNNF